MNPSGSAATCQSDRKAKPKRTVHRIVVVACGSFALIGCLLGILIQPGWGLLAGLAGLVLVIFPEL